MDLWCSFPRLGRLLHGCSAGRSRLKNSRHLEFCKACTAMYRLQCPYPNCPITFKSQHGHTYHLRVIHSRSFQVNPSIDVMMQDLDEYHDEGHHHQHHIDDLNLWSAHRSSPVQLTNDAGQAQVGGTQATGERKEHPHLTGTSICDPYAFEALLIASTQPIISTSMRPKRQLPPTRHATAATRDCITSGLESL